MSDLIKECELTHSKDCLAVTHTIQQIKTRVAQVGGGITIQRALPSKDRKTIGAWCFLDHFGPVDLKNTNGLKVAPHPHMGLQTFTWTISGEILHRDSLGSKQVIEPGQVNLMTAGKGISHSEESLSDSILHGLQLWIALPEAARHIEPDFAHYPEIPSVQLNDTHINVLVGEFLSVQSPVKTYSPLMALEINASQETQIHVPLNPAFEYGILPLTGNIELLHNKISNDTLVYIDAHHTSLSMHLSKGAKILLLGGEPLNEDILIWWNFVARTKAEMNQAVHDWNNHTRFGEVIGYPGEDLIAPELPS